MVTNQITLLTWCISPCVQQMNRPQFESGREGKEGSRSFPEWNCRLNFLSSKKKSVDDLVVGVFVSRLFVEVFVDVVRNFDELVSKPKMLR